MSLLTVTIPTANYQIGTATIAASPVPVGAVKLTMNLDVTAWTNPLSLLLVSMEMSLDNQATWVGAGAFTTQCSADGFFRNRVGAILSSIPATFTWPAGVTHIRGTLAISGASIRTGGTVVVD